MIRDEEAVVIDREKACHGLLMMIPNHFSLMPKDPKDVHGSSPAPLPSRPPLPICRDDRMRAVAEAHRPLSFLIDC